MFSQFSLIDYGANKPLFDIFKFDSTIIIGGDECIVKSVENGLSWEVFIIPELKDVRSYSFINRNIGFVSDDDSRIYKSTDGEISWTYLYQLFTPWTQSIPVYDLVIIS